MDIRKQVANSFYNSIPLFKKLEGRLHILNRDMKDLFKKT